MPNDEALPALDIHLLEDSLRGIENFYASSLRKYQTELRGAECNLIKSDLEATVWKSRCQFLEESLLAGTRRYQLELANRSDEIALLAQQVVKKSVSREDSPSSSPGGSALIQTRETQLERLAVQMDSLNSILQMQTTSMEVAEERARNAALAAATLGKELKEARATCERLGRQVATYEKSGAFQRFLSAASAPAQVPSFLRQRAQGQIDQGALIKFLSELRAEVTELLREKNGGAE